MISARSDEGYVTLAVLVMAALLAAVVSTLLAVARPAVGLARIGADEIGAETLLDAGVNAAGYLLFVAERDPAAVSGTILRLRDGAVELLVGSESGRVDLNAAEPALLAGLFSAAGGKSLAPAAFAARVLDWRDADDRPGVGGAEAADYDGEDLAYTPSNGPFRSAQDLRLILGLSRDDVVRLLPYVTIFSGSKSVDPLSAPRIVLRAVPGLGPGEAGQIIQARAAGARGEQAIAALTARYGQYLAADALRVFRVTVTARPKSRASQSVEVVMRDVKDEAKDGADYRVMAWSRAAPPARGR